MLITGTKYEVSLKVVTTGDELVIRLIDKETNEVFAECPVENTKPVETSVEAVLDSSRYYVLKIVDPSSGNHAFIGLGFRERCESTDFMAALSDHRQYLTRKKEAEKVKEAYNSHPENHKDYSLKPGEKIKIQLPKSSGTRATDKPKAQKTSPIQTPDGGNPKAQTDDDDWGDFISS
eukprot:g2964.t1